MNTTWELRGDETATGLSFQWMDDGDTPGIGLLLLAYYDDGRAECDHEMDLTLDQARALRDWLTAAIEMERRRQGRAA